MAKNINDIFTELRFGEKLHDFYSIFSDGCGYDYIMIIPRKCMTEYKCLCKEHTD